MDNDADPTKTDEPGLADTVLTSIARVEALRKLRQMVEVVSSAPTAAIDEAAEALRPIAIRVLSAK